MSEFSVSVVIPVYNHGHLLERAVRSALDCGAAQVVISNDASTDNTHKVWFNNFYEDARVLYLVDVTQPFPYGAIFARNRGIKYAKHSLILPLDADDTLLSIAPLVEAYKPGTWVYGGWKEEGEAVSPPPPGMLATKELGWNTFLFAKADWLKVGGYDPVFSIGNEIWAFQRALNCAGIQPVRISDIIFERNTDAPNTERARAWAHVIKPLIEDRYPYRGT